MLAIAILPERCPRLLMPDTPSPELGELLNRLHLATPKQLRTIARRARRLAGELPLLDSVWIDALAQARLLTPYQAAQINAGRGEQLFVGPYIVRRLIQRLGYADCFLAREAASEDQRNKTAQSIHLLVSRGLDPAHANGAAFLLRSNIERLASINSEHLPRLEAAGTEGDMLWAAYHRAAGFPAIEWLSCQGRFPPAAALDIACQITSALAALETAGVLHGSISAESLWLHESGKIQLAHFGFQAALSTVHLLADDVYACGCLCWHLLAGRPPIATGKDQSIPHIRQLAPDVDPSLVQIIDLCTRHDPSERPQSASAVREMLGAPPAAASRLLAAHLLKSGRRAIRPHLSWRLQKAVRHSAQPLLATAACAALVLVAVLPLRHSRRGAQSAAASMNAVDSGHQSETLAESPNQVALALKPRARETADRAVRMVNYQTNELPAAAPADSSSNSARPVIELEIDAAIPAGTLRIQSGAVIRGKDQKRPTVLVPLSGLAVTADVRFENIDFLWRGRSAVIASPDEYAIVDQRTPHCEFVGCTFHVLSSDGDARPTAVRLSGARRSTTLAPAMRLKLDHCAIDGAASALTCASPGPVSIEIHDSLFLGDGSLIRFPAARPIDAPAAVELENVTLRGATSVVEINCDEPMDATAQISVTAKDSVFAPGDTGALVIFKGERDPRKASGPLKALEWSGQGSLLAPQIPIACVQHGGQRDELPEDDLTVEGLVASAFEFCGPVGSDPATSQVRKWLAPLTSDQPPGIGDGLPRIPEAK